MLLTYLSYTLLHNFLLSFMFVLTMDVLIITKNIDLSLFLIIRCSVFLIRSFSTIAIFNTSETYNIFAITNITYKNETQEEWVVNRESHLKYDFCFQIRQAVFSSLFVLSCIYTNSIHLEMLFAIFDIAHYTGSLSFFLFLLKIHTVKHLEPSPLLTTIPVHSISVFLERPTYSLV